QKSRKERRKAERNQKSVQRPHSAQFRPPRGGHEMELNSSEDEPSLKPTRHSKEEPPKRNGPTDMPKSALKKSKSRPSSNSEDSIPKAQATGHHISRAARDRLDQDDAEIAALERRLGMKGKTKNSQSLKDDGLDFLLDDLSDGSASDGEPGSKRKREEYDEFIKSKRQRSKESPSHGTNADSGLSDSDDDADDALDDVDESDKLSSNEEDDIAFEGFSSEASEEATPKPKKRENPYVPPVPTDGPSARKYIPPSMREPANSDLESMSQLRRQVQGLLNRLSEANLTTILRDIEGLYQKNPRQYVTSAAIDLLLGLLADRTRLNDTFLVLHAGFIAAMYKVVGIEFGAQVLERLTMELENSYATDQDIQSGSKVSSNLVSLLAILYTFQVVGSTLIFDYIRLYLQRVSEINTELLLLIVRNCGPQLRQDDPSSLKDIVILLQNAVHEAGEANLSVRAKFMMETVNNLKNNRSKGASSSAVIAEHVVRMKKILGSLNTRSTRASEPLRIGLNDIRNREKTGKWWLVGASWKGQDDKAVAHRDPQELKGVENLDIGDDLGDNETTTLLQLAKEQRMNTEIRRAIFISIMSASDYKDAHVRLLKLHLKKAQELEIPRVLLQCAGAEQSYNPYYTSIAKKLCTDRKLKMAFQFSLWDLFKRMGERFGDNEGEFLDSDDEEDALKMHQLVNFGKMYGALIATDSLSVAVLKNLNFAYLRPKTQAFLEVLFTTTILETLRRSKHGRDDHAVVHIFDSAAATPQVLLGLQLFFQHLLGNDVEVAKSKHEGNTVRWGFQVAKDALTRL
ncbi:hypothetical protein NA57DRAFT_10981, partial [Rhizodiscina lignyota]